MKSDNDSEVGDDSNAEKEQQKIERQAKADQALAEKKAAEEAKAAEASKAAIEKEQRVEEAKQKEAAADAESRHSSRVVIPNEVKGAPTTIIINNNMTAPTPAAPPEPKPEPTPVIHSAPEISRHEIEAPAITYVPKRPSPWHMMVSGSVFANQVDAPWSGDFGSHTTPGVGLLVTFGVDLVGGLSINAWGGISPVTNKTRFHGGADLEFLPFRLNMGSYNLLELGLLAGVSTLSYNRTSDLGPVHLGGRFNLNFNEYFGLTTSLRANQTFVMWEGGMIVRL